MTPVQAYILGQNDNDYKNIIKSVTAILFLATPHRGSRSANQLDKLLRASNPLFSRKQYVAELARNSQTLESINEEFRNLAPKLQIFSFYETLETYIGPTRMVGRIDMGRIRNKAYSVIDGSREGLLYSWLSRRSLQIFGC